MKTIEQVLLRLLWPLLATFNSAWSHLLKKSLMENFIFCAVVNVSKSAVSGGFVYIY